MSAEPFQDLVAKVEAEPDTRKKIWIVREYDVKRNGTKNNQIKSLTEQVASSEDRIMEIETKLEVSERRLKESQDARLLLAGESVKLENKAAALAVTIEIKNLAICRADHVLRDEGYSAESEERLNLHRASTIPTNVEEVLRDHNRKVREEYIAEQDAQDTLYATTCTGGQGHHVEGGRCHTCDKPWRATMEPPELEPKKPPVPAPVPEPQNEMRKESDIKP